MATPLTAVPHVFYLRPAPGWLSLLETEVTGLLSDPLQKYKFEPKLTRLKGTLKLHRTDLRQGLEILMRVATAHDMEWLLLESNCSKWSEAEAIFERIEWKDLIPDPKPPVHVSVDLNAGFTTGTSKFRDVFCKTTGLVHTTEGGLIRLKLELKASRLRISVSLAGDPLYKRGYKVNFNAPAPLPEHQAAAVIRSVLSQHENKPEIKTVFVPFAGSGTFGFEAILALSLSGPGAFQRKYACELFPVTPAATLNFIRRKLLDRLQVASPVDVIFNDFNPEAVAALKENCAAFPKKSHFEIVEKDIFQFQPEFAKEGAILMLLNPPFGDRLAQASDISSLYNRIAVYFNQLSQAYPERILAGCLCPDTASWKSLYTHLEASDVNTVHFTHGGKDMRLLQWTTMKKIPH